MLQLAWLVTIRKLMRLAFYSGMSWTDASHYNKTTPAQRAGEGPNKTENKASLFSPQHLFNCRENIGGNVNVWVYITHNGGY